ncbi:MAG: hypothetical protein WAT43_05040 [Chitinophagales bacterium]
MKNNCILIIFCILCLQAAYAQPCNPNATGNIPIPDLGIQQFNGFTGGKYPNGKNEIPVDHYNKGMLLANTIKPLNKAGEVDSLHGKIGMMVLGYSTAAMTGRFVRDIVELQKNPYLEIIIGAQGGRDINSMTDSNSTYWTNIDSTLKAQQMNRNQVQVIWMSSGDIYTFSEAFPQQCYTQLPKYQTALRNIKKYYPNCKIVFLSDRTYAGYIGINGEGPKELKEPTAYYNGWTIKWLIEKQIQDSIGYNYPDLPFLDWGPYLWTDGTTGNKQGYKWECDDAGKGGIHPSSKGRMKEAAMVYLYFKQHPYLKSLFN